MPPQFLEVSSFQHGIADPSVDLGPGSAEKCDNFILTNDLKLRTRPGSEPFGPSSIPDGLVSLGRKLETLADGTGLVALGSNSAYVTDGSTWKSVATKAGLPLDGSGRLSCAQSQKHLFVTSDSLTHKVQKIFRKPDGGYEIRTGGLPGLSSDPTITGTLFALFYYLQGLTEQIYRHMNSGIHKNTYNTAPTLVTIDPQVSPTLEQVQFQLLQAKTLYKLHTLELLQFSTVSGGSSAGSQKPGGILVPIKPVYIYHFDGSSVAKIIPATLDSTPTTVKQVWDHAYELAAVFDAHDRDVPAHSTGGQFQSAASPLVSGNAPSTYLFGFVRSCEYQTDTATFSDLSASRVVQVYGYDALPGETSQSQYPSSFTISDIGVLASSGTSIYDAANVKVKLFRSTNAGTVMRSIGEVANGTTTFTDYTKDSQVVNNEPIYTTGGVLDNDEPPVSKYLHAVGSVLYYANIKDGSTHLPFRLVQSVPGDPDSVPGSFYADFQSDIVGVSSFRSTPIVFTARGVYRVDGAFDELGRGSMSLQEVDDALDCLPHSIAQTPDGVLWWSSDGIHMTDGYKVTKLTRHLDETFKGWIGSVAKRSSIFCTVDTFSKRVIWGIKSSDQSPRPDLFVVMDMSTGKPAFFSWSGMDAVDLAVFRSSLIRMNGNSHLLSHSENLVSDAHTSAQAASTTSYTTPVVPEFISVAHGLTKGKHKAWVARLTLKMQSDSDATISCSGRNDLAGSFHALTPITPAGTGIAVHTRRFPAGTLRANAKQVRVTLGEKEIFSQGLLTALANGMLVFQDPIPAAIPVLAGSFVVLNFGPTYVRRRIVGQGQNYIQVESTSDVVGQFGTYSVIGARPTEPLLLHSYTLEFDVGSTANPQTAREA